MPLYRIISAIQDTTKNHAVLDQRNLSDITRVQQLQAEK